MKPKLGFASAFVTGLALSFWLYGGGRTMCETVGITWAGFRCGAIVGVGGPMLAALLFVPIVRRKKAFVVALTSAVVAGAIASELWILRDERIFIREVENRASLYSRARAWPNHRSSLVFVPGRGIHATD